MIFATVFCVVMAFFHAVSLIRGGTNVRAMAKWYFWSVVFAFFGCYPFGMAMNWYAFGAVWEGVPFGTDATDNKTQLLFVYLLFAWLVTMGSFTKGRFGRDLFSPKTLGWIGAIGFAVVWFIYLVPHSIQFTAAFTYAFCYSWIGIILALYVAGLVQSREGGSPRLEPGTAGRD
jgi:ABC-type Fe3+-siderophore transport system permease subunit